MTFAHAHAAFSQAWPAFALVAGLLLIGAAAAKEGVFEAAGAFVARAPGGALALLAGLLLVEAAVTAVLNLDTAVVFMTPVLLHAARRRGLDEAAFLYGAVFMANSASLLLPGANLTNLIVLSQEHANGSDFAAHFAPAWAVAVALTIAFVAVVLRPREVSAPEPQAVEARLGPGGAGIAAAAVLVLVLARPALPVLALGVAVALLARLGRRRILDAANPVLLLGVLALAVLLGTVARAVSLAPDLGRWSSAWLAAGASVVVNNLPAAVLLSAHAPTHPRALLLGLDLGPNLAITGSLSALLWLQVARRHGARPSALRYSLLGLALVPLTLAAALLVT
ncbi:MAG TPA: SLC13 family permease, partial [Gaiellaceae bacterium]|nr:SLC13 family permease [Gaiellaceae bacterium]